MNVPPRTTMMNRPKLLAAALAALLSVLFCATLPAPTSATRQDDPLKRVMELNRSGQWDEAERLARDFLTSGAGKPAAQRCEAI
jgi:hypothetical protein